MKSGPFIDDLPSGKRLHNYGKSPFYMGKLAISMAMFNSFLMLFVCLPEGTSGRLVLSMAMLDDWSETKNMFVLMVSTTLEMPYLVGGLEHFIFPYIGNPN